MKTLLQINVDANWGSAGRIAEQIGICAQEHGWDSYIALGRDNNPSQNQLIRVGSSVMYICIMPRTACLIVRGWLPLVLPRHYLQI